MLVRSDFTIKFYLPQSAAMIGLLRLYPSFDPLVRAPEVLEAHQLFTDARVPIEIAEYVDSYGNRCSKFLAPQGWLELTGSSVVDLDMSAEEIRTEAKQHPVEELPPEVLQFLLSSRYCQVDQLSLVAGDLFGHTTPGWGRVIAIRDWVHDHVRFDYASARSTKTALDVFTERVGVCRDFQHLAITLSRAMNIPCRYVTGYLGDIRRPYSGPGDFSAWYEVFLDGKWWTMDARHNDGRMGRVLMAVGRDATDVAITTSFGVADLKSFEVNSVEIDAEGNPVPLPQQ